MLPNSALQKGPEDFDHYRLEPRLEAPSADSPLHGSGMLHDHSVDPDKVRNKILSYGFGSALGSGLCASVDFLAPDEDAEGNEFRVFAAPIGSLAASF